MKLIMGCTLWVVMVQSWAQVPAPATPRTKPDVVAPLAVQPSEPLRLPGPGQTKVQKPAMSVPKQSSIKQPSLLPVSPPSLGLCDGS